MINDSSRFPLFILYIAIFIWGLYYYGPGVVFYFDQKEGNAEVTLISQKRVYLVYYHEGMKREIKLSFREGNSLKLKQLYKGKKMQIVYSNNFPNQLLILEYEYKPGLGGLVLILLMLIPIIYFKRIKFPE